MDRYSLLSASDLATERGLGRVASVEPGRAPTMASPTRTYASCAPVRFSVVRVRGRALAGLTSSIGWPHGARGHVPNRLSLSATLHCLTGCAIGEVLGLVIATALGWHDLPSVVLAIVLAFVFGYALTMRSLLAAGVAVGAALRLAFASDTLSITTMEIVDTAIVLAIPGAMAAGLDSALFWGSLAFALLVAGVVAFPVNRWLIARGRGHAVLHGHH